MKLAIPIDDDQCVDGDWYHAEDDKNDDYNDCDKVHLHEDMNE